MLMKDPENTFCLFEGRQQDRQIVVLPAGKEDCLRLLTTGSWGLCSLGGHWSSQARIQSSQAAGPTQAVAEEVGLASAVSRSPLLHSLRNCEGLAFHCGGLTSPPHCALGPQSLQGEEKLQGR